MLEPVLFRSVGNRNAVTTVSSSDSASLAKLETDALIATVAMEAVIKMFFTSGREYGIELSYSQCFALVFVCETWLTTDV